MALQSIFDPLLNPNAVSIFTEEFDYLELDATLSESHQYQIELTKHKVEEGFDITDNAKRIPIIVSISGVITDTPGTIGNNKILNSILAKPSQNAFDFFENIYENKYLCTVTTSRKEYDEYIMTDFSYRKSREESGGLFFDATFEEVRFVQAKEGQTDDIADDDKNIASSNKDKGTQKTTDATAAQEEKSKDLFFQAGDVFGGGS